MTRTELARLGGLALAAKVDNSYFAFIGRRGGRNNMARELRELAAETAEQSLTMSEHYLDKAQGWAVHTGNRVMVGLWTRDNCEPRPARHLASGDITKLRRWEKASKVAYV
jgi:hypothetical protein